MADEPEVCSKISEKVKMAGFLEKKGSMLWKKYWFVLEDKLLLYYKSQLEYINLSPCRGSLNMSLVSTLQPRRNSKDPIIHLVSRSHSFILRAKDRAAQERWLKALLDSIGKQGVASLRFSLDDLPGQLQTMTLPKRQHSGSLDAVWKPPVIPKTKMLDKVLRYEEEPDENQNTDKYDLDATARKSQTLDNRKLDSKLVKLRNAIGGRKSSAIFSNDPAAQKVRRESFLHKMFKKSPSKIEKEIAVDVEIDDPFYDTIDHVKTTMEPFKEKPVFGTKILLPEGTLAELKDRLRSKESLERISAEENEPPELPPRSFSNSMTALTTSAEQNVFKDTTEVLVHLSAGITTDSEESDLSGHYQTIKKPEERPTNLVIPSVEPEYQVVNKSKKKKYRDLENETTELQNNEECSLEETCSKSKIPEELVESKEAGENIIQDNPQIIIEEWLLEEIGVQKVPLKESEEVMDKNSLKEEFAAGDNEKRSPIAELIEVAAVCSKNMVSDAAVIDCTPAEENSEDIVEGKHKEEMQEVGEGLTDFNKFTNEAVIVNIHKKITNSMEEGVTDFNSPPNEAVSGNTNEEMNFIRVEADRWNLQEEEGVTEFNSPPNEAVLVNINEEMNFIRVEADRWNLQEEEGVTEFNSPPNEAVLVNINEEMNFIPVAEADKWNLQEAKGATDFNSQPNEAVPVNIHEEMNFIPVAEAEEVTLQEVEYGLTDLNTLLLRLTKITTAPLIERDQPKSWSGVLQPQQDSNRTDSEPDYDVPRSHAPIAPETPTEQGRIAATEFFNKIDPSTTDSSTSLEPDSLEDKIMFH